MRTYIAGSDDDVAGFALAGVTPIAAADLMAVDPDSIVILSRGVARDNAVVIDRWSRSGTGPFFVILPEWRAGFSRSS